MTRSKWLGVLALVCGTTLTLWQVTDIKDPGVPLAWALGGAIFGAVAGWLGRKGIPSWSHPAVAVPLIVFFLIGRAVKYEEDLPIQWLTLGLAFLTLFTFAVLYFRVEAEDASSDSKRA